MINYNLKHPKIIILFISERKEHAQKLYLKYGRLGARVTLKEVKPKESVKKHRGKLYYFDSVLRFKEIANILAKDVSRFEKIEVQPKYVDLKHNPDLNQWKEANYVIWLLARQETALQPATKVAKTFNLPQVTTPITNVPPRSTTDFIPKAKPNYINNTIVKPAEKALPVKDSPTSLISRGCRHCGKYTLPGEDTCYGCHSK